MRLHSASLSSCLCTLRLDHTERTPANSPPTRSGNGGMPPRIQRPARAPDLGIEDSP
jgi:hypothetical protein